MSKSWKYQYRQDIARDEAGANEKMASAVLIDAEIGA